MKNSSKSFFTREQTKSIKGLFAMVVLIHHIYQQALIGSEVLFVDYFFRTLGFLGVGVFFFISGYGLYVSMVGKFNPNKNSKAQMGGGKLLIYRVLPILFINVFLIVVYSILRFLLLDEFNLENSLKSIAFGGDVVSNGWYLQVILWLYFAFIVLSRFCDKSFLRVLSFVVVGFMAVCFLKGVKSWWYISTFCFPFGVAVAKYHNIILNKAQSKFSPFIVFVLFAIVYLLRFPDSSEQCNKGVRL